MGRRDEMKATLVNRESTSMINTINANVVWLKTRLEFSNNGFTNELNLKERVAISLLNLVCACCSWLTYIITITPKVHTIIVNTSPMSMLEIKSNLTYRILQ